MYLVKSVPHTGGATGSEMAMYPLVQHVACCSFGLCLQLECADSTKVVSLAVPAVSRQPLSPFCSARVSFGSTCVEVQQRHLAVYIHVKNFDVTHGSLQQRHAGQLMGAQGAGEELGRGQQGGECIYDLSVKYL